MTQHQGLYFFSRMRFLYSKGSQSLPTTSPALEASLHPILKYIILPIQICQGFYCICISNLIKSFSGLTFFLEGNFKLNIFFLVISLSLSSPTSRSDCKSLSIRSEARIPSYQLSLPGVWGGSVLHCQVRSTLTENLLQTSLNNFIAHISPVDHCFLPGVTSGCLVLCPKGRQG